MSIQLQLRRGSTSDHASFAGAIGEVTVDVTKEVAVVHDGSTLGGFPLQTQLAIQSNGASVVSQPSAINFAGGAVAVAAVSGVVTVTIPQDFPNNTIDLGSY